jgi:hypothetical protein
VMFVVQREIRRVVCCVLCRQGFGVDSAGSKVGIFGTKVERWDPALPKPGGCVSVSQSSMQQGLMHVHHLVSPGWALFGGGKLH